MTKPGNQQSCWAAKVRNYLNYIKVRVRAGTNGLRQTEKCKEKTLLDDGKENCKNKFDDEKEKYLKEYKDRNNKL